MAATGRMTLTAGIMRVGGIDIKLKPVKRGFLNKLLIPKMNEEEVGSDTGKGGKGRCTR